VFDRGTVHFFTLFPPRLTVLLCKAGVVIEAAQGDITRETVDAIVNAANRELAGGGGVDGAIHRAAGAADLRAACRPLAPCEVGQAKATPGFALSATWIIHTVGPIWRGGGADEAELLAACYRNSVAVVDEIGAGSVAFPAISTGVYGYPREEAARIAVATLKSVDDNKRLIRLIAYDEPTLHEYEALL